jgi:hypothetical protein
MEGVVVAAIAAALLFHLLGRWVRARCDDVEFGLFGARDTARTGS